MPAGCFASLACGIGRRLLLTASGVVWWPDDGRLSACAVETGGTATGLFPFRWALLSISPTSGLPIPRYLSDLSTTTVTREVPASRDGDRLVGTAKWLPPAGVSPGRALVVTARLHS